MMAAVRGYGNKTTELALRMILVRAGIRGWASHVRALPGRPDFAFAQRRAVIFVHGCFWHQHRRCGAGRMPASNREYWVPKLKRNVERDRASVRKLRRLGWRVLTVWECQIKQRRLADRIRRFIAR